VIDAKKLDACVHCGLCLPACPTYDATGNELDSPRGRIAIVRGLADGTIADVAVAAQHLDFCLGCRACEPACPSGVKYGRILEEGREELSRVRPRSKRADLAEKWLLRRGLGTTFGAATLMRLVWLARRTGVLGMLAKRSDAAGIAARIAPDPAWRPWSRTVPRLLPATGTRRGAVAVVPGCVMDQGFAGVHAASAALLRRAGFDVHVPRGPLCCGALTAHVGDAAGARASLGRLAAALAPFPVDAVIVNAAGCGSHLKEADWRLAGTTYDLTEWLDRRGLGFEPAPVTSRFGGAKGEPLRIAYQDACHLRHGQRIAGAPRRLLAKLRDAEIVPLGDADRCCGSAGVYNVTQPEMAAELLRAKVAAIRAARPHVLATANPGCHLQIEAGLRDAGLPVRVEHVATILAASMPPRGGAH
jgi:glycolate oxidase iron-sulfur subunit